MVESINFSFSTVELNFDNTISYRFSEFVDLMTARFREKETREDLEKVFRLFDDDNSGTSKF